MTDDQIEPFCERLETHFPQATAGDAELCWKKLISFDLKTAGMSIEQHRLELGAKVFRPDPERLARIAASLDPKSSSETGHINGETPEQREGRRAAEAAFMMERQQNARIVEMLPEEVRERLRAEVLKTLPPEQQKLLLHVSAKASVSLQAAIVARLNSTYGHPSDAPPWRVDQPANDNCSGTAQ